ncbi:MAG: serine/threonine-protein kinase, partial [Planctomycetota bacterium]
MNPLDECLLSIMDRYLEQRGDPGFEEQAFIEQELQRTIHVDGIGEQLPELMESVQAIDRLRGRTNSDFTATGGNWTAWTLPSLSGRDLGDYRIGPEIGRGGMGIVYQAWQKSLGRQVALKVLPRSVGDDQSRINRFMVEAQAAAGLEHPNVVPIYAFGCEAGIYYYCMPLIDGLTLQQRIAEQLHCEPESFQSQRWIDASLRLIRDAADALHHAHERGVVHRDIKPSNLIVDVAEKCWVTDFGLARWIRKDDQLARESLTCSGEVIGTLRYMSPEQAKGGSLLVDHRTDIYSLGLTLHELLSGMPAVPVRSLVDSVRNGDMNRPERIRVTNPGASRDLETVLLKATALDVDQRYETAADFAADLGRCLSGRPVLARRQSLVDFATRWAKRHRGAVAATFALAMVVTLGSWVVTAVFFQQRKQLAIALQEAEVNAAESREQFRETRKVLDQFGLSIAERMRSIAGAGDLGNELIQELMAYYERFAADAKNDPGLAFELGGTHQRAAAVIAEIGDDHRAVRAYRTAIEIYDSLLDEPAEALERERVVESLAECLSDLSVLLAEQGLTTEAIAGYQRGLHMLTELPPNDLRRAARARLLARWGLLESHQG